METTRKIRMIALDMDGTFTNADNVVSERDLAAVKAAMDRGVIVVACTGRFRAILPPALLALKNFRYGVFTNGSLVEDSERGILYQDLFSREIALEILTRAEEQGYVGEPSVGGILYINKRDAENERNWIAPSYHDTIGNYRTEVDEVKDLVRASKGVEKVQVFFPNATAQYAFRDEIVKAYPVDGFTSGMNNMEFMKQGVNKGTGLKALADLLGIAPEEIMVCGDEANDLPMFRLGCFNVAMGNAAAEVKAAADFVSTGNFEDGVAVAIEKFVLGQ